MRQTREEPLLHRVLRQPVVAQHAVREAVRDAADAVVELGQRRLVATRDERDERLVREMSEVLTHRPRTGDSANATTVHVDASIAA